MPALLALAQIAHQPSPLTDHLADMRQYMPERHRTLLHEIEALPGLRVPRYRDAYDALLEAIVTFRRVHYGWAQEYVNVGPTTREAQVVRLTWRG
jgi:indoleamine 2,3-dioxygenase